MQIKLILNYSSKKNSRNSCKKFIFATWMVILKNTYSTCYLNRHIVNTMNNGGPLQHKACSDNARYRLRAVQSEPLAMKIICCMKCCVHCTLLASFHSILWLLSRQKISTPAQEYEDNKRISKSVSRKRYKGFQFCTNDANPATRYDSTATQFTKAFPIIGFIASILYPKYTD